MSRPIVVDQSAPAALGRANITDLELRAAA
jgi:hypothetical protein